VPDSEYNRLSRAIRKSRAAPRPVDPKAPRAAPLPPAEDIAAIKLAQSQNAKNEFTRRILAGLAAEDAAAEDAAAAEAWGDELAAAAD
jgi:hypothetical protein